VDHTPSETWPPIRLERRRGRIELALTCVALGRDLALTLSGGDRPHLGAVAVSQSRPSHREGGGISATTSVITLPGHLEDELARALAARVSAALDTAVCAACGIHLDHLEAGELEAIEQLANALAGELLERLGGLPR